ncbi:MAG: hypothetical protein OHK0015_24140 [Chloroflexi bacterium OHK40]
MRCTGCDHLNPNDARFCTGCGAALSPASAAPLATAEAASVPAPAAAVAPAPALAQTINVTVHAPPVAPAPSPVVVVAAQTAGPGCLVRALYFCFVGIWLGAIWTGVAWLLLVSIIGLPLGLLMLNRIPQVMTLKPVRTQTHVSSQGGVVVVSQGQVAQHPFWLRALYFLLVGWWLSGVWLGAAWGIVGFSLGLGLPLAFWMFDRTPAIVSLARQ